MHKTAVVLPDRDAYVDSYLTNKKVEAGSGYFLGFYRGAIKYRILLRYPTDALPAGAKIVSATLKLAINRSEVDRETGGIFEIHAAGSDWDATRVTYADQPGVAADANPVLFRTSSGDGAAEADITAAVREWHASPDKNFGIIIKAHDEGQTPCLLGIDPRPVLEISYVPPRSSSRVLNVSDTVSILTPQFYQFDGSRCLFGGGERYLVDLAQLLKQLGYRVEVFQPSNTVDWVKSYRGINIRGLRCAPAELDFYAELNERFREAAQGSKYHLYFNMDVLYPYVFPGSICISHGIWWDSGERAWWRTQDWYDRLFAGLDGVHTLVSVDTCTINWLKTMKPDLHCRKIYIPNYVDLDQFRPDPQRPAAAKHPDSEKIRVLYPRRLCVPRGWQVSLDVAADMTARDPSLVFSFVGRGSDPGMEDYMTKLARRNPGIEYTWYEMDEMHKAYRNADIVLIPSLSSEGTSLSLLEAMACGKAVIAGLTGGLTDLVLQGYNGMLIEVTRENLRSAVRQLASDRPLREKYGVNARAAAECFSGAVWAERWEKVISEVFT